MSSRVLSVRFPEDEYQVLQSMSMMTGTTINAIIRRAVDELADRALDDPEFLKQAEETRKRLVEAADALRERISA